MKRKKRMFEPDEFYESVANIDFADLKKRGYRLVLLDLDNTLGSHGSMRADEYAIKCVAAISDQDLDCWIITNARKSRAARYASSLNLPYIALAGKPSPKAVLRACQAAGLGPDRAVLIGDQLLTDIGCANRAGSLSILVRPRFAAEPLNVRVKRFLERPLYRRYNLPVN